MARTSAKQKGFDEQAPGAGFESPDRIEELHVLGLELLTLEEERKDVQGREKTKRAAAGRALRKHGLKEYTVDGVEIWLEGKETVKVKKSGGRPKGKIKKVTADDEPPAVEPGIQDRLAAAAAEDEREN